MEKAGVKLPQLRLQAPPPPLILAKPGHECGCGYTKGSLQMEEACPTLSAERARNDAPMRNVLFLEMIKVVEEARTPVLLKTSIQR